MQLKWREYYEKKEWEDMLINNFNQGFPAFYAGHDNGTNGHAFVCDGYTDTRYFHFNWGWSGYYNGNFAIDAINPTGWVFNDGQNAIFDMIPAYAYDCMATAPVIETKANTAYSHKGTVKVNVPTTSESGVELTAIDKVVEAPVVEEEVEEEVEVETEEPEVEVEVEVKTEVEETPAPSNPSTADVSVLFYALAAISAIGGISVFKRK